MKYLLSGFGGVRWAPKEWSTQKTPPCGSLVSRYQLAGGLPAFMATPQGSDLILGLVLEWEGPQPSIQANTSQQVGNLSLNGSYRNYGGH